MATGTCTPRARDLSRDPMRGLSEFTPPAAAAEYWPGRHSACLWRVRLDAIGNPGSVREMDDLARPPRRCPGFAPRGMALLLLLL